MTTPFTPKQAIPFSGDLLDEVQCRISITASGIALSLLPPLSSTSVVHDNGCGTGAATEAVVASQPPPGIRIEGTDVAPPFIATYQERIDKFGWPAKASIADCLDLNSFADGTFTHSISAYLFMGLSDDVKAASEIRRTLAENGMAAVILWEQAPHIPAIIEASRIVRGADSLVPAPLSHQDYKASHAKAAILAAGFDESKVKVTQKQVFMQIADPVRWANLAWTFLGTPPTGWSQTDEEQWNDAVREIIVQLKKTKGARTEPNLAIPMVASIIIAQK